MINAFFKLLFVAVSMLPDIPSVKVSLQSLDLVTDCIIAVRYFLPLDTICQLTAATLTLLGFRALIALLSSKTGRALITLLVKQFSGLGSVVFSIAQILASVFGISSGGGDE